MPRGLLRFAAAVSTAIVWVVTMNIIVTNASEPGWISGGAVSVVVMVRSLLDLAEERRGRDG